MNMITSCPRRCWHAVSHPTQMTSGQQCTCVTVLATVTFCVTFGTLYRFGVNAKGSAAFAASAAMAVALLAGWYFCRNPTPAIQRVPTPVMQRVPTPIMQSESTRDYGTLLETPLHEREKVDAKNMPTAI